MVARYINKSSEIQINYVAAATPACLNVLTKDINSDKLKIWRTTMCLHQNAHTHNFYTIIILHVNDHERYDANKVSNSYSCTTSSAKTNSLRVKETRHSRKTKSTAAWQTTELTFTEILARHLKYFGKAIRHVANSNTMTVADTSGICNKQNNILRTRLLVNCNSVNLNINYTKEHATQNSSGPYCITISLALQALCTLYGVLGHNNNKAQQCSMFLRS